MSDSMIAPFENWDTMAVAQNVSPRPRGVWCQAAGTFTATGKNGVSKDWTMTAGTFIPCRLVTVTAIASGTFYLVW